MTELSYPQRAGFKAHGASELAARQVDANRQRKFDAFVGIVMETIFDPDVINVIAERIHEHRDYASPLASRLVAFGILSKGSLGRNADTDRVAHVYVEGPLLVQAVERYQPTDEDELRGVVKELIKECWLTPKASKKARIRRAG